jgi:hypothetical protein
MSSDKYRRIHLACLDMAKQSSVPDAQARWLAMATASLNLAINAAERSRDATEANMTPLAKNDLAGAQERLRKALIKLSEK